jgi:hypothetical protein
MAQSTDGRVRSRQESGAREPATMTLKAVEQDAGEVRRNRE